MTVQRVTRHRHIVIVGASLAGLHAARALRDAGYEHRITLVGDEPRLPYDRPPLSKSFLAGPADDSAIELCADGTVADGIDLALGVRATGIDLHGRRIRFNDGTQCEYSGLIVATGARPRTLAGLDGLAGVYTLRGVDDARAIRAEFARRPARVTVIGAGFIGAEVAAAARSQGLDVTLIDPAPAPCLRGLGPRVGAALADLYRANGIDLRLGVGVAGVDGHGRVERIRLADGFAIDTDVAIVGVGVVPNTEFLDGCGLTIDDGLVCDATGLAGPDVTAAGDVARRPSLRFGGTVRIEHWDNAIAQGAAAARRLLVPDDEAEIFDPVPWFWSDQFDWNIQLAGHPGANDTLTVVTGRLGEPPFAAVYACDGRPTGFVGVNAGALVRKARRLLASDAPLDAFLTLTDRAAKPALR